LLLEFPLRDFLVEFLLSDFLIGAVG